MTEPAAAHPDIDALCDLDAGLLEGTSRESDIQAHVAACAACADFVAVLATTRAQLAALPAAPMPADVAARIDAALSAEAAGDVETAPTTDAVVTPLRSPSRSRRSRWLPGAGAVAAGVALLMAGAVGIGALNAISEKSAPISGGAESASAPRAGARDTGNERNYTPATLADGVRALVGGRSGSGALPQTQSSSAPLPLSTDQDSAGPPAVSGLRSPAALAACVAELAGKEGVTPLAVDYARFQGEPAVVIALPDVDPAIVQAWVVGPACSTGKSDVRHFQVVPRSR